MVIHGNTKLSSIQELLWSSPVCCVWLMFSSIVPVQPLRLHNLSRASNQTEVMVEICRGQIYRTGIMKL